MIEEPYRWVEAIANRREYIETQLSGGSPIAAVSCRDGILFLTVGRNRQKLFEIYDRIAMGAIGHPGDIERLRMAAIELASTEGFTRSAADVSLRRLAHYSLSPILKNAFEQVYGAPFLARMIFAELGSHAESDLFVRLDYDGSIATNGGGPGGVRSDFSALSGTHFSTELMESFFATAHEGNATLHRALQIAGDAWSVGNLALGESGIRELPTREKIAEYRSAELKLDAIQAALLERDSTSAIRYRTISEAELQAAFPR